MFQEDRPPTLYLTLISCYIRPKFPSQSSGKCASWELASALHYGACCFQMASVNHSSRPNSVRPDSAFTFVSNMQNSAGSQQRRHQDLAQSRLCSGLLHDNDLCILLSASGPLLGPHACDLLHRTARGYDAHGSTLVLVQPHCV